MTYPALQLGQRPKSVAIVFPNEEITPLHAGPLSHTPQPGSLGFLQTLAKDISASGVQWTSAATWVGRMGASAIAPGLQFAQVSHSCHPYIRQHRHPTLHSQTDTPQQCRQRHQIVTSRPLRLALPM